MYSPVVNISRRPERTAVVALLKSANLPTADLTEEHLEHFFFVGSLSVPIGLVGLEVLGKHALLRSLVVAPDHQASGTGTALVDHAEGHARAQGVEAVFLLTTTAEHFFARRGYRRVERSVAPESICSTREFSDMCPKTSAFMVKYL
jgi:amino-acid N-acetyltransferase